MVKRQDIWDKKRQDIWDRKDDIISDYNKDFSQEELANKYDCSQWTIFNLLNQCNVKKRKIGKLNKKPNLKNRINLPENEILKLYKSKSVPLIAEKFCVSNNTIYRLLERNNIKRIPGRLMKGKRNSPRTEFKKGEVNEKALIKNKALWNDEEYKSNQLLKMKQNLNLKPNKPEKQIINIIDKNKIDLDYVGDWTFVINGFNPDFINRNKKKIVEFFGNYWHSREEVLERDKRKIKVYNKQGYDVLIIRDEDLENENFLCQKLTKFLKDKI